MLTCLRLTSNAFRSCRESPAEAGDPSRTLNNSSDTLSGCSRMRRILFRRTRSDSDDRMRNADRVSKADSVANAALESAHPRLTYPVPPTVLEEGSAASAPVSALSRLQSVMPNSPPPPYDTNPEVGRARKKGHGICPMLIRHLVLTLIVLERLVRSSANSNSRHGLSADLR